ncbi:MAG: hypothetical protein WCG55_03860 [bacterium]
MFEQILGVFFPDICVGCGVRGCLLCEECRRGLPQASPAEHPWITSLFAYQDSRVRSLIKKIKFKNTRHGVDVFAEALARAVTEYVGEETLMIGERTLLLVPIPLSKKRAKLRGYNQSELVARKMLRYLDRDRFRIDTKLLVKEIETTAQSDIKKKSERLANLGSCFRATRGSRGECIILIDDVTTTGATLGAARSSLRAAHFTHVHAFTIAH